MKTAAFILTILLSSICEAQNTFPKNELGLNLYGNEYQLLPLKNPVELKHFVLTGLQYKRNLNQKYLLRFLFNYKNESYNEVYPDWWTFGGTMYVSGIIKTQDYKIGIEKVFGIKKIKPFVFIDLGYKYFNDKGINSVMYQSLNYYNYDLTHHYFNYCIGFGLKYYPTNHIYLSTETCFGYNREIFDGSVNPNFKEFFNPINTFVFGVRF
jgi:hypothetical protein